MMRFPFFVKLAIAFVWYDHNAVAAQSESRNSSRIPGSLPPQSVFIDPLSINVLGPNFNFRNSSFTDLFNPTSTIPSFFQVFDRAFLDILGPNPSFNIVSTNNTNPSAFREAPVYVPQTDEVFFSSVSLNSLGKISMSAIEHALRSVNGTNGTVNVPPTTIPTPDTVVQVAGGAGPFGSQSSLIFVTVGFDRLPPSVVLLNPKPPYNVTVLLDNFFGRQFNSLDDVKIHPVSGAIFFTDVEFGALLQTRPPPQLPNQVYRLDTKTGAVRVVATEFQLCNGIAFSRDGKTAYVSDTGALIASTSTPNSTTTTSLGIDHTKTAVIYQFDVDVKTQAFSNRRVFAYVDAGIPDGIELDANGNVYAGCSDGVNVWSPQGVLLGKFFTGATVANMVFAGDGRLVILGGTNLFLAKIAAKAGKVSFP